MRSLHFKTHLATIRAISIPALVSILIPILKEESTYFPATDELAVKLSRICTFPRMYVQKAKPSKS